jgi:3D-(3,5/4)-trihydroxycyclohexane-1,2-dione acylhydrolase (decyclizing)
VNHGFQSIHGVAARDRGDDLGERSPHRRPGASAPDGDFLELDYAANAASLDCAAAVARDVDGLRAALAAAREEPRPSLIA